MKIVVAVDDSDCSQYSIDYILKRAWSTDTEFLVLNVVEPIPVEVGVGYMPPPSGEIEQRLYDESAEMVAKAAALLRDKFPQLKVDVKVATGLAAETICNVATAFDADLILMGSHGRKGISHFFLGSVAEEVLKKSSCSVEVIKRKASKTVTKSEDKMEKTGASK